MGEVPADEGALMQSVLNDPEAKYNSADLNVAYKMPVDEYQKLCPFASMLEENWGKPPGAAKPSAGACSSWLAWPCRIAPVWASCLCSQAYSMLAVCAVAAWVSVHSAWDQAQHVML